MKRNFTFTHFKLVLSAVLLFAMNTANATFIPVTIPTTGPNGFNADVVADGVNPNATPNNARILASTTAAFDANTYNLVATGYSPCNNSANTNCNPVLPALPANGIITSTGTANLFWQLAPYFGISGALSNNSIRMTGTGSYTIAVPSNHIGDVYILGASTGGATTVNITLKFVGGTTQVFNSQSFADWMNGNPYEYLGAGRVIRSSGLGDQTLAGINPRFYAVKLALPITQYNKQIDSIVITKVTSATVLNILGVTIDHQPCLPIQTTPAVIAGTVGLTSANVIITPPPSLAPGYTPPQNYEYIVTTLPTPPTGVPAAGSSTFTLSGPGPTDTLYLTNLPSGTTQYLHIRSNCGTSVSLWRTISFTTITCSPPSLVTAAPGSLNMTQVTINWNLPTQTQTVTPPLVNSTSGYEWALTNSVTPPASGTIVTPQGTAPWSMPFSGLTANTQYWFHIRKQCTAGTTYSNWVTYTFTTLACPNTSMAPVVPTVPATSITTVSARFNWKIPANSSNPSVGYEYAVTTTSSPPLSGISMPPVVGAPGTLAYDTAAYNLIPQTTYWLHLRNVCSGGYYSNWISVQFVTKNCPSAGTPTITSNTPGTMSFTWPGTNIPGWFQYQYQITTTNVTPTTWVPTSATSVTLNVAPGATYWFWVRSNCTSTNAPWLFVSAVNPFPPCLAPIGMSITNVNMHGAAITWTKGFNWLSYQVAVTTSTNPPANGISVPDTFYNATGLISGGQKYYVHVRTYCGSTPTPPILNNFSPWIKDSFNTTANCLPPVINSSSVHIQNVTSSSAEILWNFYPGLYGYEFILNKDPNTPTVPGLPINYNAYHPVNLSSGTTYYLHLRSRCDTLNYSPWVTVSFETDEVCNVPATVPVVTHHTDTKAWFSWTPISGAVRYEYEVSTSALPPASGSGQFTTVTNLNANNLQPNTQYWFHLRSACSDDDQTAWSTVSFTTYKLGVGNLNGGNQFGLDVYPNPVNDVLNVDISGRHGNSARIQLVDMAGKIVETISVDKDKAQINTSKLPAGMYLLKYVDSENAGVIRVEKQ